MISGFITSVLYACGEKIENGETCGKYELSSDEKLIVYNIRSNIKPNKA